MNILQSSMQFIFLYVLPPLINDMLRGRQLLPFLEYKLVHDLIGCLKIAQNAKIDAYNHHI